MYDKSKVLFERAQRSIPGGVNSPVRAFKSVGGTPLFIKNAKGAYLYDADGDKYIDYIASWGPMILGHAYEPVVKAIQEKAWGSTSFGAPTELEIEMAELIISMVPNIDLLRMVSSGTEACMSAIRLARGYTGKNKIIKFEGHYHGHADPFLVKAGSGVATFNIQNVGGNLFVTYAKVDVEEGEEEKGPGLGFVDIYSPDGQLIKRFASEGKLNAPWGVAQAPASWLKGAASSTVIVVGNFGNGHINAYDAANGTWLGTLKSNGTVITIDGLWGISFKPSGAAALNGDWLYFAAGPSNETKGVFGYVTK